MSSSHGASVSTEAEDEYDRFIWANLRRNYAAHYLHGMLGMTGFRLVNAPTFVPAYLHAMSGSDTVVGLGLALQQLGGVLSPVVGAASVEHRPKVVPAAMIMGTLMRLPVLAMALAAWTLHSPWLEWTFVTLLFLLGLFTGGQRVVFQMLLAKMIPISRRGRLQAARNFTGGIIAAGLSYVAGRYLIQQNWFGNGYATTFLIAFALTSLGMTIFRLLVREPIPPSVRPVTPLLSRLKTFHAPIAGDRDYRNFLMVQALAMGGRIASPFYILYVAKVVHMTGASLGLFSLVYLGADTVSNLAWGYLGDKFGFRSNFVGALILWIAALLLLLMAHSTAPLLGAFFGLGAAQAGYQMSTQTMVLEFGARQDVAMRLAISGTVESAVSTLAPLIGGFLAGFAGYRTDFLVSLVFYIAALGLISFGVKEPRSRSPQQREPLSEPSRT